MRHQERKLDVLRWSEFCHLSARMGFTGFRSQKQNKGNVLAGKLYCQQYPGGMSIHYGSTVELQDLSNSSELPAGISFNLLMSGNADFALSGKRYQLRKNTENTEPECCVIILNNEEIMTRFLKCDNRVSKLNIFLSKAWFEARCESKEIPELINIFRHHARVLHWQPSDALLKLGRELLALTPEPSLGKSIGVESVVLAVTEKFISELSAQLEKIQHTEQAMVAPGLVKQMLISELEKYWEPGVSLESVATKMNMSVSTLQRRFKEKYNITVVEFLRQRKLDQARRSLLNGERSIGEVAFSAGYNHSSNFISAFKKRFGVTPRQLLQAHAVNLR